MTFRPNSTTRAWYTTGKPTLRRASSAARMSATPTPCKRWQQQGSALED